MLVIREDQIQALAAHRRQQFVDKLDALLRSWKPQLDPAEIERGLTLATRLGFESERDVAAFIELVILDLDGFTDPLPKPALAFLTAHGVSPATRLNRLAEWIANHE